MATQKAFASYQEITDLHTESDKVSVIGIHTPQGDTPRKMFGGFFDQFKKFKYIGASVTLVPAARLPVDPLGVSYEAGEPTIDPRDVLNPILFHGCHGNDLGSILNKLYGNPDYEDVNDSLDILESQEATIVDGYVGTLQRLYYMALTDNTWRKAHPQKGFKKGGLRPLVYSLASTRQIAPGYHSNVSFDGFANIGDPDGGDFNEDDSWTSTITRATPQFITPRLTSLGWLDTRNVLQVPVSVADPIESSEIGDASFTTQLAMAEQNDVTLPKIFMGVILLPPAYKTEQYFRMIINHHFAFKGFRGISLRNDQVGNGALPGNVVNANSGYSDNMNADGWIEGFSGDSPFDPPEPEPPTPAADIYLGTFDRNFTFNGADKAAYLRAGVTSDGVNVAGQLNVTGYVSSQACEYVVSRDSSGTSRIDIVYFSGDAMCYVDTSDSSHVYWGPVSNPVKTEAEWTFTTSTQSADDIQATIRAGTSVDWRVVS